MRGFLWQIMTDSTRHQPLLVPSGEALGISGGLGMRRAIGVTFQGDCGNADGRRLCQPAFQHIVTRLAFGQAKPLAVIMDGDADMIWIVERLRAAGKGSVFKFPLRRGCLPDEFGEVPAVSCIAGPATARSEIELVPPCVLGRGRQRRLAGFLVADEIAADGNQRLAPLRP